jgi:hypothetical protein
MPEEKKKVRQCIIKDRGYNSYYYGGSTYGSELTRAIIFDEDKIPEHIKNNPKEEQIIFLDTKEGLELLVKEYKTLQHYKDIYEPRVNDAKEGMKKLLGFDSVKKYIELHNKWNHPILGINHETENKIIEEIVAGKE